MTDPSPTPPVPFAPTLDWLNLPAPLWDAHGGPGRITPMAPDPITAVWRRFMEGVRKGRAERPEARCWRQATVDEAVAP